MSLNSNKNLWFSEKEWTKATFLFRPAPFRSLRAPFTHFLPLYEWVAVDVALVFISIYMSFLSDSW